jgi:hypothetical protein
MVTILRYWDAQGIVYPDARHQAKGHQGVKKISNSLRPLFYYRRREETMEVYWANVEFDIKNPPAYENCVGGFVYMFLKAGDVLDAIPIIREALEGEDLRLNAIEFIAPYEQSPWTIQEDQALYDSLGTNFK